MRNDHLAPIFRDIVNSFGVGLDADEPAMPCETCDLAELCEMGQPCPRHNEPQAEDEV